MAAGMLNSRPVKAALAAVALFIVLSAALAYQTREPPPPKVIIPPEPKLVSIDDVYQPSIRPDNPVYTHYGVGEWKLDPAKPVYHPEPLGKSLVVLDLDSRPLNEEGEVFGPLPLSWDVGARISGPSMGTLQHWLYAKIHGYTYYFIQTGEYKDRRDSWKKPSIIKRVLQKHPALVFMDSDAIVSHLDLPFEWLMNYWGIDPENDSLALAVDPMAKANSDEKGRVYANTGFIIAQSLPVTFDLLRDWDDCPNAGSKFPNCTDYRDKWHQHPSDQGGFGNYVRYLYDDHIRELSCKEANGYPEHISSCKGTFIKHIWDRKNDLLKIAVGEQVPGAMLKAFHKQMMKEMDQFYFTEEQMMTEEWLAGTLKGGRPKREPEGAPGGADGNAAKAAPKGA